MTIQATAHNAHGAITQSEIRVNSAAEAASLELSGALKLIVQDTQLAEQWMDQKQWTLQWRETDILYQSPRMLATFEGSNVTRSNVSRFTVATHTNSLVPTMMSGIFYDTPPFVLRPKPGTKQQTVRAKTALFGALMEEIGFKQECEAGIENQVLNGTGIWKYGHVTETRKEKRFIRKRAPLRLAVPFGDAKEIHTQESDEFEVKEVEVTRWRPFFESKELGTILVAPGWNRANQLWKAKYVIERQYVTFKDLQRLRDDQGYDIPGDAELQSWFFPQTEAPAAPSRVEEQSQASQSVVHHAEGRNVPDTVDPLEQPLELLERWDRERVIVCVQRKRVVRNETHEFGGPPYLSANWWNIKNAGYGMGVGRLVGSDQRVDQGLTNAALDILSYAVNPQYAVAKGANVPTQQIRQRLAGIIQVEGKVEEAFKIVEQPKVPPEVWGAIQNSKQSSESASGANEPFTQGSLPGRGGSSIGRTATGAGQIAAANASRIQGPVGRFVDNVFIEFIVALDAMVNEHMPLSEIRQILSDELGEEFEVDMENFLNARLKYEVLAGAHLAAKKAMAQSLPWMIQILENPHMLESLNATGWTVDLKEVFDMMFEVSEWKNSRQVVRRLTPEEAQAMQQMNPGVQKVQGDIAKIQAKHEADKDLTEQKQEGRMAEKLLENAADRAMGYTERVAMERALEPFALGSSAHGEQASYNTTGA